MTFFFSSRRRHTRYIGDWSSDVCSSDLNGKLRLMQEYFATVPDPERGWALAALTGELGFAEAKPSQVRDLAISRVDPELFGWSLDFVGDLAETVALSWPSHHPHPPRPDGPGPSPSRNA